MSIHELIGNLHMHTPFSDGEGYHAEIAQAAISASLDFIIVTDHNVLVEGIPPYHFSQDKKKRVLVMTGEEVHDQALLPQSNHLLVYNTQRELASYAQDTQALIHEVNHSGGLCFCAHPFDYTSKLIDYEPIHWRRWDVKGFNGLEIWNYMSEFVSLLTSVQGAIKYARNPELGITGPNPETLKKWDELTATGLKIVGIGNSDAHATKVKKFGQSAVIFPYEMLFRAVNTHLLVNEELNGEINHDSQLIYTAIRNGHCFIGYDLPHPTRGFRFSAQGEKGSATMGDEISMGAGITIQVSIPAKAEIRLIHNGNVVVKREADTHLMYIADKPGAYRIESYIDFKGKKRGWIFSNPIYIR